MYKTATVCALAMLGLAAPAFASSEPSAIDADATYAQADAQVEDADDHAQFRSGKRPASRPSTASRSNGSARPSGAPPSRTPPARTSAPSQREVAETHRVTSSSRPAPAARPSTTARTTRPGTGPSRPGGPSEHAVANGRPNPNARTTVTTARPTYARPGTTVRPPTGRPTAVRPGPTVRPGPSVRPGPTVVHTRPTTVYTRPGTVVHHRPTVVRRPVVHTVRYTHVYPYHGIFVYGPRPVTHVHYVHSGPGPVRVEREHLPKREIDREESLAIGLKGGSMISGTNDGQLYGDPGLGLVGRYRPAESVGLELGVSHHASPFAGVRSNTQIAPSLELFAFPWTRVSPYALAGATWNAASFADEVWNGNGYDAVRNVDSQWGLHAGLGLELALAKNFAIDLEGRYIGWIDERMQGEAPGAIQATAGMLVHFK